MLIYSFDALMKSKGFIMKMKQTLALLACTFLLFGCGGGGGSPAAVDPPAPPPPPPPVATNPGGIWEGTYTAAGTVVNLAGVFTETGEGRFFDDMGAQYVVTDVSGNDGNVTMNVTAFAPFGFVFLDGSTVTTGTIDGTVVERVSIEGDYSLATGETGTISLTYNALYDRDSSLAKLTGMWSETNGIVTVDPDGSFFEQDSFGCVADGQASIIDPAYNVYALTMTVSLCGAGVDGQYAGLGILADFNVTDDLFILQMNSDTRIITMSLLRL